MDRSERPRNLRQVEELDLLAVDERVERAHRAAVRRAEGDECPRVAPAFEALEEVTGDQPAHGMPDQHKLRVARAARRPPGLQPLAPLAREPSCGDTVVPPPVVRELEEIP